MLPWQRAVADLTGEIDPDTGRYAYNRVVLLAPRRAGKSLLMLARALSTCTTPRSRAFYTAAHAQNAARMWRDDWFHAVAGFDPDERWLHITRGNGQEAIAFRPGEGAGTFRLVAPTGAAIRGAATNLVIIDEGRELSPDAGDELEAAAFPTLATGRGGQAWIVSSAGDGSSSWLARWRDLGRAAVAADRRRGICHVEYAAPDGSDPDDPATWYLAHPGLAAGNVNLDAVVADHETMPPDVFAAEYLGWWPEALVDAVLVDAWHAGTGDVDLADPVVFAVEVDEDRSTCDIVAVGAGPGGQVVELVEHREHGQWVAGRLAELAERWSPLAVVYDRAGPAAALAPELLDVPARVIAYTTYDVTAAAGWFYDAVIAGRVGHRADVDLDAAFVAARWRRAGGARLFDRRQPGAGPLIAATMAAWGHRDGMNRPPGVS